MTRSRTRSRLLGLGAVVASAALVVSAVPPASAEDVDAPPGVTVFTATGHGYGHGNGLSQYGAQGAANQGLSWRQIVGFYYPGTGIGRVRGPIKVLITADTSKDVMVDARDGLRLRPLAGKRSFVLAKVRPKATRWRIVPKGTRSIVSYRQPGRSGWKKWTAFKGAAEFTAGNKPVTLRLPKRGAVEYRGALRSVERDTVNVLPLDRYLQGVVASEVPAEWPAQAVRAQAVAARSYAAYERATATGHYDICDTTSCQVYGGFDDEEPGSNDAIRRTRGRVVTYQGEPAFTQFSSSNGGWTSAGSQPYLVAQPDPYEASSTNPYANWTATVTRAAIEKAWPEVGTLSDMSFTRNGNGDWGGRIVSVTLTGDKGSVKVTGDDFRYLLGLRSTWFKLEPATPRDLVGRLAPWARTGVS